MDEIWLRAFCEVARVGSISRAAAELGYTQSAVSRQLQALEADLGAGLLVRVSRGVRLTPRGAALLPRAREIVGQLEQARAEVAEAATAEVRLRVGSVPSATAAVVVPALALLEREQPSLAVSLRQGAAASLASAVGAGELDAAVVLGWQPRRGDKLLGVPLLVDELKLIAPRGHRLVGGSPVVLAELEEEDWVEAAGDREGLVRRAARRAGLVPRRVRGAPDHAARLAYVSNGLGLALVPGLVASELPAGLVALPIQDAPRRELTWLIRSEEEQDGDRAGSVLSAVRSALLRVTERLR